MREIGTVCISTEEYIADKMEIFTLKESLEKAHEALTASNKMFLKVSDAVRDYVIHYETSNPGVIHIYPDSIVALMEAAGYSTETIEVEIEKWVKEHEHND